MHKKVTVIISILLHGVLTSCFVAKENYSKSPQKAVIKITYEKDIKSIIITKCAPCHLSTGDETSYDNFTSTRENIEDIIRRVKLHPEHHGFMPQKNPPLSDSLIQVLEQWKLDSLSER